MGNIIHLNIKKSYIDFTPSVDKVLSEFASRVKDGNIKSIFVASIDVDGSIDIASNRSEITELVCMLEIIKTYFMNNIVMVDDE